MGSGYEVFNKSQMMHKSCFFMFFFYRESMSIFYRMQTIAIALRPVEEEGVGEYKTARDGMIYLFIFM